MALLTYNLLIVLFFPLLILLLLLRLAWGKEDRANWGERWGWYPEAIERDTRWPRFWVHAVSVGEVMAAAPVLREVRRRWPDALIVLSATTIGGRAVACRQVPPADFVVYYPLDFPLSVWRALDTVRPDAVLLMEWEIWPNLLTVAKRRGAKITVLNGRISDKGLRRSGFGRLFVQAGLEAVDLFAMQSEEDARRAVLMGAPAARVRTLGNTKFDESVAMLTPEERNALRQDLGIPPDVPVWVCGSTRPGEEAMIASSARTVRERFPDLHLIVAPRHLERADEAAAPFATAVRRSRGEKGPTLLLDTFGELARVYAVADVAFVGGSLLPYGGQSVFQPLAQGVPALFGPHMSNQRDIAALARTAGVGFEVTDAATLSAAVNRLLSLPDSEKQELRRRARSLIEKNQGVAARCVDAVQGLLETV